MSVRLGILMLMVLALVGCTGTPQFGASEALSRAPMLGVVADENLRVVEALPGGAAEEIGLKVGDVLLDLTWIPSSTPVATVMPISSESTGGASEDANALVIQDGDVVTEIVPIPAPTIPPEQYMETATVPFTDVDRMPSLIGYGFPLRIRIQRDGEILEMTIVPNRSVFRTLAPDESPPTPMPDNFYIY